MQTCSISFFALKANVNQQRDFILAQGLQNKLDLTEREVARLSTLLASLHIRQVDFKNHTVLLQIAPA